MVETPARVPVQVRETDWLRVVHGVTRFVFRGDEEARHAAGTAFGTALPAGCGRAVAHGARAALALGPDEHLLLVPEQDATALAAEIVQALAGRPHALVDVGHRQVALELTGAHAEWLLAAQCPLPLDMEAFPVGACTRTVFAKAGIVVWRTAPETFRIEVARSLCHYVVDLLGEIARELAASPRAAGGRS